MNIGIDARLYGIKHAGIGRYITNLVQGLIHSQGNTQFTLFLPKEKAHSIKWPANTNVVTCDIPHYTLREQILFLRLLNQYNLDLAHFPHFNVPVLYRKPFIVTIHDILWHQVRGRGVTTLPTAVYAAKYFGYRFTVSQAVKNAAQIITPSQFVADQITNQFPKVSPDKISVIYEGIDHCSSPQEKSNQSNTKGTLTKQLIKRGNYFLYVGSCYPHKNVDTLIRAMKTLNQENSQHKLVIVSSRNIFRNKLENLVKQIGLKETVIFAGFVPDSDLKLLYNKAIALVHPSLSEGFGLTGLEAMANDCPVISSQAGSLPEVYDQAALYITQPTHPGLLAQTMIQLSQDNSMRQKLIKQGRDQAAKYRWHKTINQTLKAYDQVIKNN